MKRLKLQFQPGKQEPNFNMSSIIVKLTYTAGYVTFAQCTDFRYILTELMITEMFCSGFLFSVSPALRRIPSTTGPHVGAKLSEAQIENRLFESHDDEL